MSMLTNSIRPAAKEANYAGPAYADLSLRSTCSRCNKIGYTHKRSHHPVYTMLCTPCIDDIDKLKEARKAGKNNLLTEKIPLDISTSL